MTQLNTAGPAAAPRRDSQWPADLAGVLGQVNGLLAEGKPADALALLGKEKNASPWLQTARGVCQLRLGHAAGAVEVFAPLVLANGGVVLRQDVPAVFRANYAAALLATGNLPGAKWVLGEIGPDGHPLADRLREGLGRWRAGLTFWQRLRLTFGGEPDAPPTFDFPLGDLA